jgi:hypothetical protein
LLCIDSHHKLIRWRIINHGGKDGYSRLIVYLDCATNNRSTTVYNLFLKAVDRYHLPSCVRSDQGLENILVARHMVETRGFHRKSMITGCSTHNQRIERLWKDLHKSATVLHYKLFYFMESIGIFDPLNEHHLWALHYVYLPRISRSLKEFCNSWNNHLVRAEHHKSPHQIYTSGILLFQHSNLDAFDYYENVDESYGVDVNGPISLPGSEVIVPSTSFCLSDDNLRTLQDLVDPLLPSDNYGIDLY